MNDETPLVNDGYRNFMAQVGTEGGKAASGHYVLNLLNPAELVTMYRTSWLSQKIVDIVADDATRQWRNWNAEKEEITKIEDEEKRLRVKEKLRAAMISARLFGISAIHFALDGDTPETLKDPLDPSAVGLGGIRHLTVIPYTCLHPEPVNNDPLSEYYGQIEYYTVHNGSAITSGQLRVTIHVSRLILLFGKKLPEGAYNGTAQNHADSVLQVVYESIRDTDAITANVNGLVFESKIDIVKIKNLNRDIVKPDYEKALLSRFSLANRVKGNNSLLILDGEEEYERKNGNFGELPEIMDRFFQNAAGAADIPLTRLYGMSPAGMNATGESDLRNYYDRVKTLQELDIDPQMSLFNETLKFSALGGDHPEIFHEWRSLWQISDKERVDIGKIVAETSKILADGIINPDAVSDATANALIEYGVMPGLEAAIDEFGAIPPEPTLEEQAAMLGVPANNPQAPGQAPVQQAPQPRPKRVAANDMEPASLYLRRDLVNADEFRAWAAEQGFTGLVDDLHVTVAYSRTPLDWMKVGNPWEATLELPEGGPRAVVRFDGGAIVLEFASSELRWRNEAVLEAGGSSSRPEYKPHVTITYENPDIDLSKVTPYRGRLVFGPEIFEEIVEEYVPPTSTKDDEAEIADVIAKTRGDGGRWVTEGRLTRILRALSKGKFFTPEKTQEKPVTNGETEE